MTFSQELKNKKHSIGMRKWIYVLLGVTIIGGGYFLSSQNTPVENEVITETYTVSKGNLDLYVSGEGKIISGKKIELNFPVSGTIESIYKTEGDDVVVGEKIAQLDDNSFEIQLEKANLNLKNARAVLNDKKDHLSSTEKQVLLKNLELAESNYNKKVLELDNKLQEEKNNYNLLVLKQSNLAENIKGEQENIDLLITDTQKKIENLEKNIEYKSSILILDIQKYILKLDELLGVTAQNKNINDSFEDYLGAKNTTLKSQTSSDLKEFITNFEAKKQELSSNNDLLLSLGEDLESILENTVQVINNSIESTKFTLDDISGYKTTFNSYVSDFELNKQAFQLAKNSYEYEITNSEVSMNQKNHAIEVMIGDLEVLNKDIKNYSQKITNLESQNTQDKLIAKNEFEKIQLDYNNAIAGPSQTQLQPYYIAIEEAQSQVKQAQQDISNTVLKSPVDGTVLDINYREGEYYGVRQESFGVIISIDGSYVESFIEERDIANIELGQEVEVSVDAFESFSFTGVVDYVSHLGEEDRDEVIRYKVLVEIDDTVERIKNGMSVSLDFLHEELEDILYIPSDYISYKDGKARVKMLNGSYKNIQEGKSDGEIIEIISGLQLGEIITK